MVQHREVQHGTCFSHLAGKLEISFRGLEVSAGVVVRQDYGSCTAFEGYLENAFGISNGSALASLGQLVVTHDFVGTIQKDDVEVFDVVELAIPAVEQSVVGIPGTGDFHHVRGTYVVAVANFDFCQVLVEEVD